MVLLAPSVRVLAPTVSKIVLFPAVKSKSVNAVKAVIEPPNEVAVPPIVIALLAKLAFAIEPANIALVIPLALTRKLSESISIEESSTPTANETELPKATEPPPDNPSPAVTVIDELDNFELAMDPASSSLETPESLIVTAPLVTEKLSVLNEAIPLLVEVASSPAIVIVVPVAEVSIPSPPATVKVSLSISISIVPLSVVASKSCAVTCASTYALILC